MSPLHLSGYAGAVARWAGSGRVALTSGPRQLTYDEWLNRGEGLAAALVARGLKGPSRIAALLPNGPELLVALYACARSGLTLVPLSTWSTASELRRVLAAADPELVLTSDEFSSAPQTLVRAAFLEAAPSRVHGHGHWRRAMWAWQVAGGRLAGLPRVDELLAGVEGTGCPPDLEHSDADLVVLYTSGSTGQPKGVRLRQSAIRENGIAIASRMGYRDGERVFTNFPLFFSGGLCNALSGTLAVGGELVTQPRFDPAGAVALIRDRRCTARIIWRDGLRPIVEAGLTADDVRRMSRGLLVDPYLLTELEIAGDLGVNMYGMTETATAFTCGDSTDPYELRCRTHGAPMSGNEVRVVDPETGQPVRVGEAGELWVRGPRLFSGYTDGSEDELMDQDGFFRTGDVGCLDPSGHVHYVGRTKTLIKVKGLTVQPEEVEATLSSLAGVRRAVVAGLGEGDESTGIGALVVVEPSSGLDNESIVAHCRSQLSAYKVPAVWIVDESEFPLSASLKPDRVSARRLLARS